jgi:hypothetical protein
MKCKVCKEEINLTVSVIVCLRWTKERSCGYKY